MRTRTPTGTGRCGPGQPPPPRSPAASSKSTPTTLRAVIADPPGGPEALRIVERLCAPDTQVVRVPDNIDLITAAGIPEVFVTAHDALFTRGHLVAGETVLVHGGAGGVGTAAIQLAHRAGARVVATAATPER